MEYGAIASTRTDDIVVATLQSHINYDVACSSHGTQLGYKQLDVVLK
jgi:hypothetical protein